MTPPSRIPNNISRNRRQQQQVTKAESIKHADIKESWSSKGSQIMLLNVEAKGFQARRRPTYFAPGGSGSGNRRGQCGDQRARCLVELAREASAAAAVAVASLGIAADGPRADVHGVGVRGVGTAADASVVHATISSLHRGKIVLDSFDGGLAGYQQRGRGLVKEYTTEQSQTRKEATNHNLPVPLARHGGGGRGTASCTSTSCYACPSSNQQNEMK